MAGGRTGSSSIIIFMLKNYGPQEYAEKQVVEHQGTDFQPVIQYQLPSNGRDQKEG